MEKTGQMIEFEEETGGYAIVTVKVGFAELQFPSEVYVEWLETELLKASVKAEAYDRLMSGGRKTLKEWANILGMIITFNPRSEDNTNVFTEKPYLYYPNDYAEKINSPRCWTSNGVEYYIPEELIDFTGDWKDSLTMPDRWREK